MSTRIDEIFDAYERGALSRREVLAALASFIALGSAAGEAHAEATAAKPLVAAGRTHINHVNLRVADVARSHAFYERFFGLEMTKAATYNALDTGGGTFISLQTKADIDREAFRTSQDAVEWARTPNEEPGMIEHFCLEVEGFDLEATREALRAEGHEAVEVYGNLLTADPDGILVQIIDSKLEFGHEDG